MKVAVNGTDTSDWDSPPGDMIGCSTGSTAQPASTPDTTGQAANQGGNGQNQNQGQNKGRGRGKKGRPPRH